MDIKYNYNSYRSDFKRIFRQLYFTDVIQNVNFYLNEKGCNLSSQVTMVTEYLSTSINARYCYFNDQFVIFMKEANSSQPYFALKVDNTDILEKRDETDEPKILDSTVVNPEMYKEFLDGGEYKFYEDENYEYYYTSHKSPVVTVWFKDGEHDTVENALKDGKITMDLLDKYGVEYIKKEK